MISRGASRLEFFQFETYGKKVMNFRSDSVRKLVRIHSSSVHVTPPLLFILILAIAFFSATPKAFSFNTNEIGCLAGTIQAEASNQSERGQIAVGCVVLNRLRSGTWVPAGMPNTICNITRRGQFARRAPNAQFKKIANQLSEQKCQTEGLSDLIGFYNSAVGPGKKAKRVCPAPGSTKIIGNHTFYSKTLDSCPSQVPTKKQKVDKKKLKNEPKKKDSSAHSPLKKTQVEKNKSKQPRATQGNKKRTLRSHDDSNEGDRGGSR